ncbi:putative nucleoredoxin 1-2 [Hibiscus syriacus]|uniref:protein-disulfide reductase n=1 Tax=Hibiscus syriacus TaxID=106335 RepID=A0A6A3AM57_HIBSY|nr:putative nucleoredoxin 1-2 [Hibiscus syriacus]
MAEAADNVVETINGGCHDFKSFSYSDRDFLVRNNADQVKIDSLKGKKLGLYFSASWCGPCRRFTPNLIEVYSALSSKGDFEVIFVSADEERSHSMVTSLRCHGLRSLLRFHDPQALGRVVQGTVSDLEGKTVGLYFSAFSFKPCADFTLKLAEVYKKLKEKGEDFEVVMISLEDEEESFKESFGAPWLALPFKDKSCEKLARYFELSTLPTVVIIGPDGKTLHPNAADAIDEHGIEAYPFTPEKFAELKEIEKAKEAAQTLESVLISGDLDHVIGKDGTKVKVTDLVGKTVLLYFSAHWCPPCRAFTPNLVEVYKKIKEKDEAFEVIFISSDRDQTSFEEYYSEMPWLALPFGDARKSSLSRKFKVQGIPKLVAIGTTGKTITTDARGLVKAHGADAYPFTEERLKEIEAQYEEMAKGWPQKLKHKLHEEHELELTRRGSYVCDGCEKTGEIWSFYCGECDFDLHPKCALEKDKETKGDVEEGNTKEGWVCDGEVCTRAS